MSIAKTSTATSQITREEIIKSRQDQGCKCDEMRRQEGHGWWMHTLVDAPEAAAADEAAPSQAGQARAVQAVLLGQAPPCPAGGFGQRRSPPAAPCPSAVLWLCNSDSPMCYLSHENAVSSVPHCMRQVALFICAAAISLSSSNEKYCSNETHQRHRKG